jgi:hypothetical protein
MQAAGIAPGLAKRQGRKPVTKRRTLSRRGFLQRSAAASATMIAAPFVRTARAAGKLSVGFWDHWVPGANGTSLALVEEWGQKERVEVQVDYITSQGLRTC